MQVQGPGETRVSFYLHGRPASQSQLETPAVSVRWGKPNPVDGCFRAKMDRAVVFVAGRFVYG